MTVTFWLAKCIFNFSLLVNMGLTSNVNEVNALTETENMYCNGLHMLMLNILSRQYLCVVLVLWVAVFAVLRPL